MSISPKSEGKGFQRLICFKYYIIYWNKTVDSIFGLTLQKFRIISENSLNKSCRPLNLYKKVSGRTCLSPPGVEQGAWKINMFQILYCTEMENRFIFLLNAAEITDYIKKLIK